MYSNREEVVQPIDAKPALVRELEEGARPVLAQAQDDRQSQTIDELQGLLAAAREQEAEIRRSPQGDRDGMLTWLRREKASLKVRIKAQEKQMELARAQPTQEPR